MDLYAFVLWLIGLGGGIVILFYLCRSLILRKATIDLEKKSEELEALFKKVQLKINQLRNEYGEPQEMVAEGLQGLDLQTILPSLVGNLNPEMLKSLGLPAWLLPVAQGFLKKMAEKQQGATNEKPQHPSQM